jgi:hypothetical protein
MSDADRVPSKRRTAFRVVAGLLGVVTLAALVPFTISSYTNEADAIHRMHQTAGLITFGGLLGVLLLVCAWRPEEELVAFRVVAASSIANVIAGLISGDLVAGGAIVALVALAVTWALHPLRCDVARFGAARIEPLAVAVLALVPAVAWALTQSRLQRNGNPVLDPHAELHHYSSMASVSLALVGAGLVAAFDGPGRAFAGRFVGACWSLAGVASLALQDHVGAFDPLWSWALVVGGVAYVAASELAERRPTVAAAAA